VRPQSYIGWNIRLGDESEACQVSPCWTKNGGEISVENIQILNSGVTEVRQQRECAPLLQSRTLFACPSVSPRPRINVLCVGRVL
jgi:hypothetical protein